MEETQQGHTRMRRGGVCVSLEVLWAKDPKDRPKGDNSDSTIEELELYEFFCRNQGAFEEEVAKQKKQNYV